MVKKLKKMLAELETFAEELETRGLTAEMRDLDKAANKIEDVIVVFEGL